MLVGLIGLVRGQVPPWLGAAGEYIVLAEGAITLGAGASITGAGNVGAQTATTVGAGAVRGTDAPPTQAAIDDMHSAFNGPWPTSTTGVVMGGGHIYQHRPGPGRLLLQCRRQHRRRCHRHARRRRRHRRRLHLHHERGDEPRRGRKDSARKRRQGFERVLAYRYGFDGRSRRRARRHFGLQGRGDFGSRRRARRQPPVPEGHHAGHRRGDHVSIEAPALLQGSLQVDRDGTRILLAE
jgi:hypothetical protein